MNEDYCKCSTTQTRQQSANCPKCKKITFFHLQQQIEEQRQREAESSINESFESAIDTPINEPPQNAIDPPEISQHLNGEQISIIQQTHGDYTPTIIQSPTGSPVRSRTGTLVTQLSSESSHSQTSSQTSLAQPSHIHLQEQLPLGPSPILPLT